MHRIRTATLLCVALAVLFAGSVQAAAPLTYADARGDALDGRASMDILRVTIDKRQVNERGPKSLVFELELAAPPETETSSRLGTTYGIRTVMEGCGPFQAYLHRRGSAWFEDAFIYMGCLGRDSFRPATVTVDKNVVRWTISLNHLPDRFRTGALGRIRGFTSITEPVTGYYGTGNIQSEDGPLPIDLAATDQTWSY